MKKPGKLPRALIVAEASSPMYDKCAKIFRLTPQQKAALYDEIYELYMEKYLKECDEQQYILFREAEQRMALQPGLGMVAYMFKRVAPTFCDATPVMLLYGAIENWKSDECLDKLCVFMQIAAFRWSVIEKRMVTCAQSRVGRAGNKWDHSEEGKFIIPIFQQMQRNSIPFRDGYENIIKALVDQRSILHEVINTIIKRYRRSRTVSNQRASKKFEILCNKMEDENVVLEAICMNLLKIESLKKRYADKYRRWLENNKFKPLFYFQSLDVTFDLEEMLEYWWPTMSPWPIDVCLTNYQPKQESLIEILLAEASEISSP